MRRKKYWQLALLAGVLSALWTAAPAITVTVNQGIQFQTIEGIGPMENASSWRYKEGPFYYDVNLDDLGYFDTLVDDGGFTALRADPVTAFQPTQGDFSITGGVRTELENEAKYFRAARERGEPFRILWSCWSPPPWMKANNHCCDRGDNDQENYLLPAHYTDFAEHWNRLLQIAKDTFDIDVYAISLQNEPLFNEPYASCNYTLGPGCGWNGICYNNMFRVVAPLINSAHPDVKIVASEDLNRTTVESNLRNDPISEPLVYAWATHNDFIGSFAYWDDRPIWQTEPHPEGFMSDAQMCMSNLEAGASAWFDWGYSNGDCRNNGTPTIDCLKAGTYSSLKMYARYIRPGARRVQSTGGLSGQYGVIAFYHPEDTCLTIVLINSTGTAQPATLNISGGYQPASLQAYRSTTSEDEVDAGTVAINGTYSMPPNSVTTLVAGNYRATGGVKVAPSVRRARPQVDRRSVLRYYALDGRLVGTGTSSARGSRNLSAGVYCTAGVADAARRAVVVGK